MLALLTAAILFQDKSPEELIQSLRSDKVEDRDIATKKLKELGETARPFLVKAATDKDTEVSNRAESLLSLLDEARARATLQKIQEVFETAKVLRVRLSSTENLPRTATTGSKPRFEAEATFVLGQGNRAWVETTVWRGENSTFKQSIVSDGARLKAKWSGPLGEGEKAGDCFPALNKYLAASLLYRISNDPLEFMRVTLFIVPPKETAKHYQVSDVKVGQDGRSRYLTYTVHCERETPPSANVKLWFNPDTYKPLKRHITIDSKREVSAAEIFEEVTLDPEIPEELFRVQETKK